MGLPQLTFELKKAADTVAARTAQGVIGMILKDTKSVGVHVIYQESDIPTDLGADNIAYIKQALIGYVNRPTCIYLAVVSSEDGTVSDGFAALGQYSYDINQALTKGRENAPSADDTFIPGDWSYNADQDTSAAQIDDLLKQFFVETATWSLYLWENKYGIVVDESKPLADRRAAIRDKMTAAGNTTAEMVRQLAMALTGYEARVVVHSADYSFSLEFLGEENTLADIDVSQVRKMVEQIKPAHLQFIISGLTWNDIESVCLTWQWFDDTPVFWAEFESKFCIHSKV